MDQKLRQENSLENLLTDNLLWELNNADHQQKLQSLYTISKRKGIGWLDLDKNHYPEQKFHKWTRSSQFWINIEDRNKNNGNARETIIINIPDMAFKQRIVSATLKSTENGTFPRRQLGRRYAENSINFRYAIYGKKLDNRKVKVRFIELRSFID